MNRPAMTFIHFYIDYDLIFIYFYIFYIRYICIYILLIYSRPILSFAWLTGYATRPMLLSYTAHTDSFTVHNNNNIRLLCLRGSRTPRRRKLDVMDRDLEIEKGRAGLLSAAIDTLLWVV